MFFACAHVWAQEEDLNVWSERYVPYQWSFEVGCTNYTLTLTQATNLWISWGDGTVSNYTGSSTCNKFYSSSNTYTISISGVVSRIRLMGDAKLKRLTTPMAGLPTLNSLEGTFLNNTKLIYVCLGIFDYVTNVTTFKQCLRGCPSLPSIPANISTNHWRVTSYEGFFQGDTGLSNLPDVVIRTTNSVTCIYLYNATGLTNIPAGHFDYIPNANSFAYVFNTCDGLTGLPPALFANNPKVVTYAYAFYQCYGLTNLPSDLVATGAALVSVNRFFAYDASMGGAAIPLWDTTKWPNATDEAYCYSGCTNLSDYADIPAAYK